MRRRNYTSLVAALMFPAATALAQDNVVGVWKTIDDSSGKPRALVRMSEAGGEIRGHIEQIFPEPGEDPNPRCEKCEGSLKGQPIIGLRIVSGMKREGSEYAGGQILDPANGNIYKAKMTLMQGATKLEVRGYVGVPLLGRSQTWVRVE